MQTINKALSDDARRRLKELEELPGTATEGDVSVEHEIDNQIEEDLRTSKEPNLL